MCGICGKVNFGSEPVDSALIERMCRTIIHRGPDAERIHTAPHVGLGQTRLSIIDLRNAATAPLANEDESVWVVFNGEIYNFEELRSELIAQGHTFRTRTDTEVIVHLYEQYGVKCLARMRGMFAFAVWDAKKKLLFAARDRLGKKPFFYAKTDRSLVFGSEIKAITACPDIPVAPNYYAIDRYLTYQYVPSPLTAFDGISKLPPAHFLLCGTDGNLAVQRYWAPAEQEEDTAASEVEIQEELLRLLRESVRLRMTSDVPLGAFLSGGVDSGTVVALMAEESSQRVKTFSIGFKEESHNELPFARQLAERYGTEHHEFVVQPDAAEVLPLLVHHYNEPFADSSALPTYYVSKLTREHVTVALSGDGGDENFAGYARYSEIARWSAADTIPQWVRRPACSMLGSAMDALPYSNSRAKVSRALQMAGSRFPERYQLHMTTVKPQEKRSLYSREFKSFIHDAERVDPVSQLPWDSDMDMVDWMMRHDQHFYLPDCLMVKCDIAAMANSLEVRCPLLDHTFVEFASSIPSRYKQNSSGTKAIFRNAVKHLLPESILNKPKTGFSVPLAKWFGDDLFDMLRGTLLDERCAKRNLLNPSFVERMVDEQRTGTRDWSNRLWALLCLELWFREFID